MNIFCIHIVSNNTLSCPCTTDSSTNQHSLSAWYTFQLFRDPRWFLIKIVVCVTKCCFIITFCLSKVNWTKHAWYWLQSLGSRLEWKKYIQQLQCEIYLNLYLKIGYITHLTFEEAVYIYCTYLQFSESPLLQYSELAPLHIKEGAELLKQECHHLWNFVC